MLTERSTKHSQNGCKTCKTRHIKVRIGIRKGLMVSATKNVHDVRIATKEIVNVFMHLNLPDGIPPHHLLIKPSQVLLLRSHILNNLLHSNTLHLEHRLCHQPQPQANGLLTKMFIGHPAPNPSRSQIHSDHDPVAVQVLPPLLPLRNSVIRPQQARRLYETPFS